MEPWCLAVHTALLHRDSKSNDCWFLITEYKVSLIMEKVSANHQSEHMLGQCLYKPGIPSNHLGRLTKICLVIVKSTSFLFAMLWWPGFVLPKYCAVHCINGFRIFCGWEKWVKLLDALRESQNIFQNDYPSVNSWSLTSSQELQFSAPFGFCLVIIGTCAAEAQSLLTSWLLRKSLFMCR